MLNNVNYYEQSNNKTGTELMLAMQIDSYERREIEEINTGFDDDNSTVEIVVLYSGNLENIERTIGFSYEKLLTNYAIINIAVDKISLLEKNAEIIWIEKPKLIEYENKTEMKTTVVNQLSCISSLSAYPYYLSGRGVICAVIDSGANIYRNEFINDDGSSRIICFFDEERNIYYKNQELTRIIMNKESDSSNFDRTKHGTKVAGIINEIAPDSDLLIVKLKNKATTVDVMRGIDFSIRYAIEEKKPLVINLSLGNNFGSHNGNTILEKYIFDVSFLSKISIVCGSGNDALTGKHFKTRLKAKNVFSDFFVNKFESSIIVDIWKSPIDDIEIYLISPSNDVFGPFYKSSVYMKFETESSIIYVQYGTETPYNPLEEIYIAIKKNNEYFEEGIWRIELNPRIILDGTVDIYLPVSSETMGNSFFTLPDPLNTLTIPSSADSVITVGAFDPLTNTYASFSGRGYTTDGRIKPDILAPGVNIKVLSDANTGYETASGTSFATPVVTASAALFMEWGITRGNDPYMFGEKLKSLFIRGADRSGQTYPNPLSGFGNLCPIKSLIISSDYDTI